MTMVTAAPYMPTRAAVSDWTTPEEVLEPVRKVFGGEIDFDPCGNPSSIVRSKRQVWLPKWACFAGLHPLPSDAPPDVTVGDGLLTSWKGSTFVNPPYDAKTLTRFMAKSVASASRGVPVIMLTKVKLIKGWHASVPAAPAVCFIDHRLTFGGGNGDSAPFDCALILWSQSRTLVNRFSLEMESLGDVMFHLGGR